MPWFDLPDQRGRLPETSDATSSHPPVRRSAEALACWIGTRLECPHVAAGVRTSPWVGSATSQSRFQAYRDRYGCRQPRRLSDPRLVRGLCCYLLRSMVVPPVWRIQQMGRYPPLAAFVRSQSWPELPVLIQ